MTATTEQTSTEPMTLTPVLQAMGISVGYGAIPVVRELDLYVNPGEVVAVLGANGAGKSTTLMGLAGVLPLSGGQVAFHGKPTTHPLFKRVRHGLGYLPEQRAIFRELTTHENLRLGRGDPERAEELIPELQALRRRKAGLLSGGEQQFLALARALAAEPAILLCDELSLGLAPRILDRIFDIIQTAAARGVALLLVEQHVQAALELSDRAYVLRRGAVVMSGPSTELVNRMDEIEAHYLSATDENNTGT